MILSFRPIVHWPAGWDKAAPPRNGSPFSATYSQTLDLLERELTHLGAKDPILQVDADEKDVRMDGQLRANALVGYPGVILSFITEDHGTLTYPCNAFAGYANRGWHANLRAIALGLEALRKVERYGIAERGQQYAGWKELGSGSIALGGDAMTVHEAAHYIGGFILQSMGTDWSEEIDADPLFALALVRDAVKRSHPDVDGNADVFHKVQVAREVLHTEARRTGRPF